MRPRTLEEVQNLKKYDEFTYITRGATYKVMEDFDKENNQVLVCMYKDFTHGGFDESDTYYLSEEMLCDGLKITSDMQNMDYFVKKFQEYSNSTKELLPPLEVADLDTMYICYRNNGYTANDKLRCLLERFSEMSEADVRVVADYFDNTVGPYLADACGTYAALHRSSKLEKTDENRKDLETLFAICKKTFSWISEASIENALKFSCWYWNH